MRYSLILFIFFVFTLSGCSNKISPKDVVKEYLAAIDAMDFKKAEKFIIRNQENLKALENMKKFSENMSPSEREQYIANRETYNFKEEDVTNTSAKVIATSNKSDLTVVIEFLLEKINGAWLIKSFVTV